MEIGLILAVFLFSLLFLYKGSDWFVDAAISIAKNLHIPEVLIGATIVSLATTAPEFFVSVTATILHHPDMATGNSVGSAICNIGLVLSIGCLISAMSVERKVLLGQGFIMAGASLLLFLISFQGIISRPSSVLLLFAAFGYLLFSFRRAKESNSGVRSQGSGVSRKSLKRDILFFILGASLVIIGSRLILYSGVKLAHFLSIPEGIISLSLIAFGTSIPELVTCLNSIRKKHKGITLGNIMGANILDLLWVLGVCGLIHPLPITSQMNNWTLPFLLLLSLVMILFGLTGKKILRWEGGIILSLYIFYLLRLFQLL